MNTEYSEEQTISILEKCRSWSFSMTDADLESVVSTASAEAEAQINFTDGVTPKMKDACSSPIQRELKLFKNIFYSFIKSMNLKPEEIRNLNEYITNLDKIDDEFENRKTEALKNLETDFEYSRIKDELEVAKTRYIEIQREEGNREPNKFPGWLYCLGLVLLGMTEVLLNYDFIQNFIGIPAFSFGVAAMCGLAIATASHLHGTILKQGKYYFGDHVDEGKGRKIIEICFGLFLVVSVCAFIFIIRFNYIHSQYSELQDVYNILGATTSGTLSPMYAALTSLIPNLLVWIVGLLWAVWAHDSNPDFADAYKQKNLLQTKMDRSSKDYKRKIKKYEAQMNFKKEKLLNTIQSIKQELGYQWIMFTEAQEIRRKTITTCTEKINNLYNHYHNALIMKLEETKKDIYNNGNAISLDSLRKIKTNVDSRYISNLIL